MYKEQLYSCLLLFCSVSCFIFLHQSLLWIDVEFIPHWRTPRRDRATSPAASLGCSAHARSGTLDNQETEKLKKLVKKWKTVFHPEITIAQSPAVGVIMEHALTILPRSPLRGKESRPHRDTHGWRPRQDSKRSQEPLILLDLSLNTALLFHVIYQRRGRAAERQIKFSRSPDWLQSYIFSADAWACKARSTCERSDIWGCLGCLFSTPENWNNSWFAG